MNLPSGAAGTYCGAARDAGRSERDEAVATRVRDLSDREKEAMIVKLCQSKGNECGMSLHSDQPWWSAAHMPRQLEVSRLRPRHACHMSGVRGEHPWTRHMSAATNNEHHFTRILQSRNLLNCTTTSSRGVLQAKY
jgi:hypothetical protein